MLTTEEYAQQIREQKIKELREILDKMKNKINSMWQKNIHNKVTDENLLDEELHLRKEYLKLVRKYLRLKGVIKI